MKALIEKWEAEAAADDDRESSWASQWCGGVAYCAASLSRYLARCAPRTVAPSIAEFKAHEAVHGPWLKVKLAHCKGATPRWYLMRAVAHQWSPGDGYIEISLPGMGWVIDCGGECYPWRYCDEEGESVPGTEVTP